MQILKNVWQAVDFVRRLVLNLVFFGLLALAVAVWMLMTPGTPAVSTGSLLVLDLRGAVVESDPMRSVSGELRSVLGGARETTRLIDVVDALHRAATDDDIAGAVIDVEGLEKLGLADAHTIGRAVDHFRQRSGKPVYAWSANYTQAQYAAAAHADVLALHPMGSVMIRGLSGTTLYWGGLLERLGIGVSVFKAGAFKSAPEVWTRSAPTEDNLEAQKSYLSDAWRHFAGDLESARGLIPGSVDAYLKGLPERLRVNGNPALIIREAGLVTDLLTKDEFEKVLAGRFAGGDVAKLTRIGFEDYLAARRGDEPQGDRIAVVLAEGAIASGGIGGINPEELIGRLDAAAKAPGTRALVLRISSPGGDAFGAEAIREKLASIRAGGLPVIVSMGDAAASGGYWLSLAADRIVADPLTLTGSIGVFSIVPDAADLLARLDVGAHGWRTGEFADFGNPVRRPGEAESALLRAGVERTYERFVDLTVRSRGKTAEEVEALAQGRVWTGAQAAENGLVDKLGDMADAVKLARRTAGVKDDAAPVRIFDASPEGMSGLLSGLSGEVLARMGLVGAGALAASGPDAAAALRSSGRPLAWSPVSAGL